jgi:hypothetical protein
MLCWTLSNNLCNTPLVFLIYPCSAFWKKITKTIESFIFYSVLCDELDFLAGDSSLHCCSEDFLKNHVADCFNKVEPVHTFTNVDSSEGGQIPIGVGILAR